ncbi:MAG TPA: hypothetical protein VEM96_14280 [Pyrinomonadaceae bacterium]|nr:hypothetical protein [Pyrinomonadaceae bacterium]
MSNSNPPSTDSSAHVDFSKTKKVVITDLAIRAVSAVAVVAIGVVSFFIQQHLQSAQATVAAKEKTQQEAANARDEEEQAYLPCFRGISEVDLALEEVSAQFGWPTYTKDEADRENRLGTRLAYIADSLYFPAAAKQGGPEIQILTAADNARKNELAPGEGQKISLTVEDAVRMLSEVLRIAPMLWQMNQKPNLTVLVKNGSLEFDTPDGKFVDSIPLEERTVPAFKQWLSPMKAHDLYTDVDVTGMADEIGRQLADIAKAEIRQHPKLADKYVVIRSDVLRGRQELLSLAK